MNVNLRSIFYKKEKAKLRAAARNFLLMGVFQRACERFLWAARGFGELCVRLSGLGRLRFLRCFECDVGF